MSQPSSGLLALPRELLDQIFSHIFPVADFLTLPDGESSQLTSQRLSTFRALIRTNKLLSKAAIELLYTTNDFLIYGRDVFEPCDVAFRAFSSNTSEWNVLLLQKLDIRVWGYEGDICAYLELLLRHKSHGMDLTDLSITLVGEWVPVYEHAACFLPGGSAREMVLQLKLQRLRILHSKREDGFEEEMGEHEDLEELVEQMAIQAPSDALTEEEASHKALVSATSPLLRLPRELLDQILSYLVPFELKRGSNAYPSRIEDDIDIQQRPDGRLIFGGSRQRLGPYRSLIKTNRLLSEAATFMLYSTMQFSFSSWPSTDPCDKSLGTFMSQVRQQSLMLIRRIQIDAYGKEGCYEDDIRRYLGRLLECQKLGMNLNYLEVWIEGAAEASVFLRGGVARELILQLRSLKRLEFGFGNDHDPPIPDEDLKDLAEFEQMTADKDRKLILEEAPEVNVSLESPVTSSSPTSRLLALPRELLDNILSYLLPIERNPIGPITSEEQYMNRLTRPYVDGIHIRSGRAQPYVLPQLSAFRSLIRTNKSLSAAAIHMLYTTTLFAFSTVSIWNTICDTSLRDFLPLIHRRNLALIRKAYVVVYFVSQDHLHDTCRYLERFLEFQRNGMRLMHLEILFAGYWVSSLFFRGGRGREIILQLRSLRSLKFHDAKVYCFEADLRDLEELDELEQLVAEQGRDAQR